MSELGGRPALGALARAWGRIRIIGFGGHRLTLLVAGAVGAAAVLLGASLAA